MTKPVSLATVPLSRFHTIATRSSHRLDQPAIISPAFTAPAAIADAEVCRLYTDFTAHEPLIVPFATPIESARRWVKQARARLLLVVDPLESFLGVVSVADLFSGRATGLQAAAQAPARLTVADIMTPKTQLYGIPHAALYRATVADVHKTLSLVDSTWQLVVDVDQHTVCGVVSREPWRVENDVVEPATAGGLADFHGWVSAPLFRVST
jgi:hypothetical protein